MSMFMIMEVLVLLFHMKLMHLENSTRRYNYKSIHPQITTHAHKYTHTYTHARRHALTVTGTHTDHFKIEREGHV